MAFYGSVQTSKFYLLAKQFAAFIANAWVLIQVSAFAATVLKALLIIQIALLTAENPFPLYSHTEP